MVHPENPIHKNLHRNTMDNLKHASTHPETPKQKTLKEH